MPPRALYPTAAHPNRTKPPNPGRLPCLERGRCAFPSCAQAHDGIMDGG